MYMNNLLPRSLAIAAILALWPSLASAIEKRDFWISDTVDLLDLCTTPVDDPLRSQAINYCMAYLDGAVDYHDAISDHKDMKRLICYPNTASLEEGVLVFIAWAQANQSDKKLMDEPTVIGVVRALEAKWPCDQ